MIYWYENKIERDEQNWISSKKILSEDGQVSYDYYLVIYFIGFLIKNILKK